MPGRSRIAINDRKYGDDERRVTMRTSQPGGTLLVSLRLNQNGTMALDVTNGWGERVEIWSGRVVCEDGERVAVFTYSPALFAAAEIAAGEWAGETAGDRPGEIED